MTISAKVIAASRRDEGAKIATLQLRYPRFIHAEFMTHRMFSRNASSSRAIPVSRLISDIENDPAMPVHWGAKQSGMQAFNESFDLVTDPWTGELLSREDAWGRARDQQLRWAEAFDAAGYAKQIVNRRIENDGHINVIVTATEWDNFFALRLHPDAQPEIQELARVMKEALDGASYERLGNNMWHRPYVTPAERTSLSLRGQCLVSAARCARVSYMTHDGKEPDVAADLALAEKLLASKHMSPFEHQAMVYGMNTTRYYNLRGFRSFRMDLDQ